MKIPVNSDAEASWIFDEIGQITQSAEIVKESFRKLELSDALVREVIQNSLDARVSGATLKVLFSFNKIKNEFASGYLKTLLDHLEAEKYPKGGPVLPEELISEVKTSPLVNVLCIEDLGTTGLDGDVMSLESNFGAFFRGEGISSKEGTKGGRWGQGKTTLNMASKIKSFWGLTRRHSDSLEYLMGKALLYPHTSRGKHYVTSGLYTNSKSMPLSDTAVLKEFKRRMQCIREASESGLSLIIPFPLEEITKESIMKAALIHYFFPTIKKDLTIIIRDNDRLLHTIDDTTIGDLVEALDWSDTSWERQKTEEILEVIQFSKECVDILSNETLIELPNTVGTSLQITEDTIQESCEIGTLMNDFNIGTPLGFKIPVKIILKDETEKSSHFFIFIKKYPYTEMTRSDEYSMRSGINLPGESRKLGGRPVRGILYADDQVISEFLGDAEEPMHTKWNELNLLLGEKYANHRRTLRFIRNAMKDIVLILDMPTRDRDYDLLDHIFSIPKPDSPDDPKPDDEKIITDPDPDPPPLPPSDRLFIVNKISNGFIIKSDAKMWEYPLSVWLRVAYDVQRGNPFTAYEIHDFDYLDDSIKVTYDRGETTNIEGNIIYFVFEHGQSSLKITGFDLNRDLIVRLGRVN